ncbi:MAG: hypothetical protein E3J21_06190 [Anaerolineales bacterium]|nr:MAG: hypothetical protein E3J21_06190 [Anaerolineales bacterium]
MSSVMDMYRDKATREAFAAKAKEVYEKIKAELEGKEGLVAIEPESGDYFVGQTLGQANEAAFAEHPDVWVYFIRIDNHEAAMPLKTW